MLIPIVLLALVLFAPLILFLSKGWATKRREILETFTDQAVKAYYSAFFKIDVGQTRGIEYFKKDFDERYGRQYFVIPSAILLIVSLFLLSLGIHHLIRIFRHGSLVDSDRQLLIAISGLARSGAASSPDRSSTRMVVLPGPAA